MHKIFLSRTALIVHNNPELFKEQIAGIVMVFTLVKPDDGFMIGNPNTLRPSQNNTLAIDDHVKTTGNNIRLGSPLYLGKGQNGLPLQNERGLIYSRN